MTQEDKQLLLKDLSARLPYGVKILYETWNYELDEELSLLERVVGIDDKFVYTKVIDRKTGEEYRDNKHPIDTFDGRPYLRPLSNMTEKEEDEFFDYYNRVEFAELQKSGNSLKAAYLGDNAKYEWLNAHHFDYRYIIDKCLAIIVTETNNPYKK